MFLDFIRTINYSHITLYLSCIVVLLLSVLFLIFHTKALKNIYSYIFRLKYDKRSVLSSANYLLNPRKFETNDCINYLNSINLNHPFKEIGIDYFIHKMNPHQMSSLLFSWEFIESDPLKIKILQAATRKNHLYFKDALEEIDFEAVSLEIKIIICHLISELQIKSIPILKKLLNDSNLNVQMNAINSYSWSIDKSINKTLAEKLVASNIKIRNKVIQELKRKNLLNMYFKDYCQDKTPPIYKTS